MDMLEGVPASKTAWPCDMVNLFTLYGVRVMVFLIGSLTTVV